MQAVISTYDVKDFYFPTLFPFKENYTLSWKGLESQIGIRIAGDLVARGATIDPKTREAIARIQGDIPKIAIKKVKDEDELNEYEIMIAMTSDNPDLRTIVEAWAEDTEFCWNGVNARLEWMALQAMSKGKITLDNANNNSVITEYNVDYTIDDTHKKGYQTGSAAWTNTSAKPISKDFKAIVKAARENGIYLKYAFMNTKTFADFTETEEVIKLSAGFAANILQAAQTPSLEAVNAALAKLSYLYGLQIIVIDQNITIEKKDGSRVSGNPFIDDVVTFTEGIEQGKTYWKRPADMSLQGTAALKVQRQHVCIKKYANEEPIEEVTEGIANAFPAWLSSTRAYLLDTTHTSWSN